MLKQLGIPYRLVEMDIKQGLTRTPEFLARNPERTDTAPAGRRPSGISPRVTQIIWHSRGGLTPVPTDRLQRRTIAQWLSFEQIQPRAQRRYVRILAAFAWQDTAEPGEKLTDAVDKGYQATRCPGKRPQRVANSRS